MTISQDWLISLHKESVSWTVKTYFKGNVSINQQKAGFIFSDKYDKFALNQVSFIMPPAREKWSEVDFLETNRIRLVPKTNLPIINLCQDNYKDRNTFIQLQNLPSNFYARMINFCQQDSIAAKKCSSKIDILKNKIVKKQHIQFRLKSK